MYSPFESGMKSGSARVFEHQIPGGQYSNLIVQCQSMGLWDQWEQVLDAYRCVCVCCYGYVSLSVSMDGPCFFAFGSGPSNAVVVAFSVVDWLLLMLLLLGAGMSTPCSETSSKSLHPPRWVIHLFLSFLILSWTLDFQTISRTLSHLCVWCCLLVVCVCLFGWCFALSICRWLEIWPCTWSLVSCPRQTCLTCPRAAASTSRTAWWV